MTAPTPQPAAADTLDRVPLRRALLSVSDKSGLIDLARALHARGVTLISTGGTAKAIAYAGIPVTGIEEVTGFPEMLDGRVKTLHPLVHGGLLGRRDLTTHTEAMAAHGIEPIDLVCVNLYPFEATIAKTGVTEAEAIEQIDIGGPSMIRSGAKNHAAVAVVTDAGQYADLIADLEANDGRTTLALRRRLAVEAFQRTAAYDAAIATHLAGPEDLTPAKLTLAYERVEALRYGENPHQRAAVYRAPNAPAGTLVTARQIHGKALSYNNMNDASAALELARSMKTTSGRTAAVIVKHTNPCGAAAADDARTAVDLAIAGDPMAAFGGILALTSPVDRAAAERIAAEGTFFEVVIAPSFDADAAEILMARWKMVRLLEVGNAAPDIRTEHKFLPGGLLVQERDLTVPDPGAWTHTAGPRPTNETLRAAAVLECVCRALSSNAVLIGGVDAGSVRVFGTGAGQMDRVASCLGAVRKAGDLAKGAIAVSDAFFPFPDGPKILIDAGVKTLIHPGGSKRDDETVVLCNQHGVTCLMTGVRHFRH